MVMPQALQLSLIILTIFIIWTHPLWNFCLMIRSNLNFLRKRNAIQYMYIQTR